MKKLLVIFTVIITFFSCENPKWYNIPAEVQDYVLEFDTYGKKYGYDFNFEATGLVIEFNNLEGTTAGVCYHEQPVIIHLDDNFWESSSANAKRAIVFHELAHGFLNRASFNDTLINGEWKSLMFDSAGDSTRAINFSGLRREYYIEELFVAAKQEVVNEPEWAEHELDYNVIKDHNKQFIFVDHFDDNSKGWQLSGQKELSNILDIESGYLKISNNNVDDVIYWKESEIDISEDYEIEVKIKINNSDPNSTAGIVWNGDGKDNAYIIAFNTSNNFLIYNTSLDYIYFYRYNQPNFITNEFNKLTIRKLNSLYYFYLNEEFIYFTDIHEDFGNILGFLAGSNSEVLVDEIFINQINPTMQKSNIGHGISFITNMGTLDLPGIRELQ